MKTAKALMAVAAASAVFLAPGSMASAACVGWYQNAQLLRVIQVDNGTVNVRASFTPTSKTSNLGELSNCSGNGGYSIYGWVANTDPENSRMLQVLLAAQLSGQKISFYVDNANCRIIEVAIGGDLGVALPASSKCSPL